ncbi:MAG TPA: ABC transporter permease [Thermoanaerobaculia bacterium]
MNAHMIKHLVLKDWYFQRRPIAAYTAGGLLGLGVVALGTGWSFYAGTVLLITFMITIGIHLAIVTVVQERTEHTLPFLMTLPISPKEYTAAKVLANLSIFLVPWGLLTGGAALLLSSEGARSGALLPFATVALTYILASYVLVLAVAIVTESQGWTLCAMGVTNLFLQFFLYWVSHMPSIERGMKGRGAVWDPTVLALLGAELAAIAVLLGLAFVFQARKRDFL